MENYFYSKNKTAKNAKTADALILHSVKKSCLVQFSKCRIAYECVFKNFSILKCVFECAFFIKMFLTFK